MPDTPLLGSRWYVNVQLVCMHAYMLMCVYRCVSERAHKQEREIERNWLIWGVQILEIFIMFHLFFSP